ncbi:hypothetical protein LCGC14_1988840, partial [marine sediment metagenome]
VCVVAKEDHETALAKMPKNLADIIRKYVEEGKIGNQEVVGFGNMSVQDFTSYSGDIGWSDEMNVAMEVWDEAEVAYDKALSDVAKFSMSFDG